jgi:tRNA pseudouridine38-40 synthase
VRTLRRLDVGRDEGDLVVLDTEADAFCHNQVRAMAGALMAVGTGRRGESWPAEVLRSERRDGAVHVAPAHGLTLEEVTYPPDDELDGQARRARSLRGEPR